MEGETTKMCNSQFEIVSDSDKYKNMYNYQISGKIHPERVHFTIVQKLPLFFENNKFGIKGEVILGIKNSNIVISLTSKDRYSSSDTANLETLKNIIEESVRMIVDSYGYVKSYCYEVEITDIKNSDLSLNYQFGVRGEWNINKDDKSTNEEFLKILNLFTDSKNEIISSVLADFRRSIKYPSMTAGFCHRAIETIRQGLFEDTSIMDNDKRRKDGWEKLRTNLDLKKEKFEEIEKFAKLNRHGEYPSITYRERESIMNFTRSIIDKTIDYISSLKLSKRI